jgi:DNA-binding transcriptional LysR family regulator
VVVPLNPWRLRLLSQLQSLGTVRAVAAAAMMSPSSVSQQLAVLEAETHTKLLERTGRRIRLTPAGTVLAAHATALLDRMDAIEAELAGLTTTPAGLVRLAAFPSALQTFVTAAIRSLGARYPAITLDVSELEPHRSIPALHRGEFDVVVTFDFADGSQPIDPAITRIPLTADEIVLVLPAGHPAAGTAPADLAELRDEAWSLDQPGSYLSDLLLRACRKAGFEPRVTGRFSSYGVLLGHVEAGLSVTLLPELAVDERYRVVTRPLAPAPRRQIMAALRRTATSRVAVEKTVAAIVASAAGN